MWVAFALGGIAAVLMGLANGSMRRLVIGGGVALAVAYFAFPMFAADGFVSRDTVSPTLFGLAPTHPALVLVLLAALVAVATARLPRRVGGSLVALGALVTAGLTWSAQAGSPQLVHLLPLPGVMEALTGLALAAALTLLGWGSRRLRIPMLVIGVAAGVVAFGFLVGPAGHRLFPNADGYYRLTTPVGESVQTAIVAEYNANLDTINAQRTRIGLHTLPPIESVKNLDTERLPEAASGKGYRMVRPAKSRYGVWVAMLLAGVLLGSGAMLAWRPRLHESGDVAGGILYAAVLLSLAPAFASTEFSFAKLAEGWPFLMKFLDRAWPPLWADPSYGQFGIFPLQEVASQMLITLEIALVGTFLGALFAVPLSFLAARNLTQGNALMRVVFAVTRGLFNLDRGVDTLILALIFVAAVGLGPFAGVLAMAIHSIADLGKLYSESIENVDRGPIEALEAVGASGSNVVRWSILPQVSPLFLGWTLYRFEINFRVSIVLGLVGAGGIGFFIQDKMSSGRYDQMIIAILAIVIVVNIIDFASSWLRSRLV